MTRPFTLLFLLALLASSESRAIVASYHRRDAYGWTLLALEVPLEGYTALAVDAPEPAAAASPAAPRVLARRIGPHVVRRMDGDRPAALVEALLRARAPALPPDTTSAAMRHLCSLLAVEVEPRSAGGHLPILVLAGPRPATELLETLANAARATPPPPPATPPASADAPAEPTALVGWWRHLVAPVEPGMLVGLLCSWETRREEAALRVVRESLVARLRARFPGSSTVERPTTRGQVLALRIAAPIDSMHACRAAVQASLEELRRSLLTAREIEALKRKVLRDEQARLGTQDRWFENELWSELAGESPQLLGDAAASWSAVSETLVRHAATTRLPTDVVVVSEGRGPEVPNDAAEVWPAPETTHLEELSEAARGTLVEAAVARTKRALLGTQGRFSVEATWFLDRSGAPVSGEVRDTIELPAGLHRTFRPSGAALVVESDLDTTGAGLGATANPGARALLERRLAFDPWGVARSFAEGPARERTYAGGTQLDGLVYQVVTAASGDDTVVAYIDPKTGLLARFTKRARDPRSLAAVLDFEARYLDYRDAGEGQYPSRIECYAEGRHVETLSVRSVTCLATVGGLR